jgi:hypothetical protein
VDVCGIERQIQANPEANLHNIAASVGEQFSPMPGQEGLVQEGGAKAWDNHLREGARRARPISLARAGRFVANPPRCRPDETRASSHRARASSWSARLQSG